MSAAVDINVLYENLEEMGAEVFDCPLSQFSASGPSPRAIWA